MSPDAASLPDDIALLKAMLIAAGAELEQLRMQVARLRRMAFGRSSEKLTHQADQLELGLEEREAEAAIAAMPATTRTREAAKPYRQPLADHLPRTGVVHEAPCVCPDCGGAMRRMGEGRQARHAPGMAANGRGPFAPATPSSSTMCLPRSGSCATSGRG